MAIPHSNTSCLLRSCLLYLTLAAACLTVVQAGVAQRRIGYRPGESISEATHKQLMDHFGPIEGRALMQYTAPTYSSLSKHGFFPEELRQQIIHETITDDMMAKGLADPFDRLFLPPPDHLYVSELRKELSRATMRLDRKLFLAIVLHYWHLLETDATPLERSVRQVLSAGISPGQPDLCQSHLASMEQAAGETLLCGVPNSSRNHSIEELEAFLADLLLVASLLREETGRDPLSSMDTHMHVALTRHRMGMLELLLRYNPSAFRSESFRPLITPFKYSYGYETEEDLAKIKQTLTVALQLMHEHNLPFPADFQQYLPHSLAKKYTFDALGVPHPSATSDE